jgi:hypothetical protein
MKMDTVSSSEMGNVPLRRGPREVSPLDYGSAGKPVNFLVVFEDVRVSQMNIGN